MNKQELKVGDEVLVRGIVNSEETNGGIHILHDMVDAFYQVSQIHQPQKVVVPKFVAEWIEYVKKDTMVGSITYALYHSTHDFPNMDAIELWREPWENQEIIARAWLDGYTVEREKLYTVIIPHSQNHRGQVQYLCKQGKNWFFCGNDINRFKTEFTKGQIEAAGFGWVFEQEFAKEVE